MINNFLQRDDLIIYYLIVSAPLLMVFFILGQNSILLGIYLSVSTFSFHQYTNKAVEAVVTEKFAFENSVLTESDIKKSTIALIDLLIAVPMFGLGEYSSIYSVTFAFGITLMILYATQYKLLEDIKSELHEITPRKKIFGLLFALSILYLFIFEPQITTISFYKDTVVPQLVQASPNDQYSPVAPIISSSNNILPTLLSLIFVLLGILFSLIYLSIVTTIIGVLLVPVGLLSYLLATPNISMSIYMKGWIVVSVVIFALLIGYYRIYIVDGKFFRISPF